VGVAEGATIEVADVSAITFEALETIDDPMTLLGQSCGRNLRK
jgi:hypothetical protein